MSPFVHNMKLLVLFSWMGRTIIERPLKEVADFLEDPASAIVYDKYIMVGLFSNCYQQPACPSSASEIKIHQSSVRF